MTHLAKLLHKDSISSHGDERMLLDRGVNDYGKGNMVAISGAFGIARAFLKIPQRGNAYCNIFITGMAELSISEKAPEILDQMHLCSK